MLKLERVVGSAVDAGIADQLHALGHAGQVEFVTIGQDDIRRHRLLVASDKGTPCAIALPRSQRLFDGAVLMLAPDRAIVVRTRENDWLALQARDSAAALELGYFAGNMHWTVRFEGPVLHVALAGPVAGYRERLAAFLQDGRAREVEGA